MPSSKLDSQYLQFPADTTANRPGTPVTGMMRYNTTIGAGEVYTPSGWGGFGSPLGTEGNPATSGTALYNDNSSLPAGIYYFKNSAGVTQAMYCDVPGGGWVLVGSNNASDSTIPGGTNRWSTAYQLNRGGTAGVLGTASPNSDFLSGSWLDTFVFTTVRCIAWGRSSTNGTFTWSNYTSSTYITAQFSLSSSGTSRYSEVIARGNVTFGGNSSVNSGGQYFVLDGIYTDNINGGFGANANQTTIGCVGVQASNGDPGGGCYLGHGSGESTSNSYEGWIDSGGGGADCQGYTTWVK